MKRSYTEFLQDILDAIKEIGLFVNDVSYEAFLLVLLPSRVFHRRVYLAVPILDFGFWIKLFQSKI